MLDRDAIRKYGIDDNRIRLVRDTALNRLTAAFSRVGGFSLATIPNYGIDYRGLERLVTADIGGKEIDGHSIALTVDGTVIYETRAIDFGFAVQELFAERLIKPNVVGGKPFIGLTREGFAYLSRQ